MSTIAKSTSPIAPAATESRDWMKTSTLELQSGSEDESDVLNAKVKECPSSQASKEGGKAAQGRGREASARRGEGKSS